MSNVDTTPAPAPDTESTTAKTTRPRTVQYGLEIVDAIPDKGAQTSPFDEFLDKIISIYNDESTRGQLFYPAGHEDAGQPKWVLVARYDHSTAAGAAANVLGQRHGKNPTVEGWDFTARRIDEGDKTGLFVRYDPTRVVPGAKEAWDRSERERKAGLAKAKEERKAKAAAEAAAAANTSGNVIPPAPAPPALPAPPVPNPSAASSQMTAGQGPSPVPAPSPTPTPQPTAPTPSAA